MYRPEKEELVQSLKTEFFEQINTVLVTQNNGMTVDEISDLRNQFRKVGGTYRVTKNTLLRLAVEKTDFEDLKDMFTGPTVITYANDPVEVSKIATKYAKENKKFSIVGGAIGKHVFDANGVKALADMPPLDTLRAKIVGILNTPATQVVRLLQAVPQETVQVQNAAVSQLVNVIRAYSSKS